MPVLTGRWIFILKKDFNAFAFKNISCCDVGGMSSVLPTATISDTDVAAEPTGTYSRRVAVGNTELILVTSKIVYIFEC